MSQIKNIIKFFSLILACSIYISNIKGMDNRKKRHSGKHTHKHHHTKNKHHHTHKKHHTGEKHHHTHKKYHHKTTTTQPTFTSIVNKIEQKQNLSNDDVTYMFYHINETDKNQWTFLHHATFFNNQDVVQLLLKGKANPNATNDMKRTPVHIAAYNARPVILKLLLDSKGLPSTKDLQGTTPLEYAKEFAFAEKDEETRKTKAFLTCMELLQPKK